MCGDCLEIGADLVKFLGCCLLAESLTLVFGTIVGGLTTALYRDESRASQIFPRLLTYRRLVIMETTYVSHLMRVCLTTVNS